MRRWFLFLALVFTTSPAAAQLPMSSTWTGTAGDNNWFNTLNWTNGIPGTGIPSANGNALFQAVGGPTAVDLQGSSTSVLDRLFFTDSPSAFTFNNGQVVLVNGAFIRVADPSATTTQVFNANVQFNGSGTFRNDGVGATMNFVNVSTTAGGELAVNTVPGTVNISGIVSGGGLTKFGTGTLNLTGNNSSFTGPTNLNGGVVSVQTVANSGVNSSLGAGTSISFNGGTLRYDNTSVDSITNRDLTLQSGGGTFDVTTASRILNLEGVIGGSGGLTKTGPGGLTVTDANTYAGPTVINGGTLFIFGLADGGLPSSLGASSSAASNLVLNGGTLHRTSGHLTTDRLFTLGPDGGTLTSEPFGGSLTFTNTGAIAMAGSGARTLTLRGQNADNRIASSLSDATGGSTSIVVDQTFWRLTGANTFTGSVSITNGSLYLVPGAEGGNAPYTLSGGSASLLLDSGTFTVGSLAGSDGNVLLLSSTLNVGSLNTNTTYAGVISGEGALTKVGTGTLSLLADNNSYTGLTTINGGVLSVQNVGAGGPSGGTGRNSFIVMNGGALQYANTTTDEVSGKFIVLNAGGGTIDVSTPGRTLELTNETSGTGALTKTGAGTLILSDVNLHTGPTTINGGVLRVNGSLAAASAVSVNNGGTLGGTGTIQGTVTVNAGGTIAPGASIGTLTVGNTIWNPGSNYVFEYDASTTTPVAGTDNDLLKGLTGSVLDLSGLSAANQFNLIVDATGLALHVPVAYRFAEFDTITGALAGDVSDLFHVTGEFSGTPTVTLFLNPSGVDILLVSIVAVPEPGSVAMILGALGLGIFEVRRRQRHARQQNARR